MSTIQETDDLIQRFGPQEYIHQEGVLNKLPEILKQRNAKRVLVLHGHRSWAAVSKYWPKLPDVQVSDMLFGGECTREEALRVQQFVGNKFDAIIAVGGGKVLDTVKLLSENWSILEILIPTLASNCACFTPKSIMYDMEGHHIGTARHKKANDVVLVEPQIIAEAPLDYFIAGIGDTLAKWFEIRVRIEQIQEDKRSFPLEQSFYFARICYEQIKKYAVAAVESAKKHQVSHAVQQIIDTIFIASGEVGGLADRFGRSVGAHAFFNASTFFPATKTILHGTSVAYGILVQLMIEQKKNEIDQLFELYKQINLPYTLESLNLSAKRTDELIQIAVQMVKPGSRLLDLPQDLNETVVFRAIQELDLRAHHFSE